VAVYCICAPLLAAMILAPTWWIAITFQALGTFFSAMGAGAGLSAIQSFAEPRRRATAVALLLFVSGLLGAGVGPYIIGVVTDLLIPRFGKDGLRYAMLMCEVMLAPGIVFFALAGARSPKDRVA
jgi:MFS family permease